MPHNAQTLLALAGAALVADTLTPDAARQLTFGFDPDGRLVGTGTINGLQVAVTVPAVDPMTLLELVAAGLNDEPTSPAEPVTPKPARRERAVDRVNAAKAKAAPAPAPEPEPDQFEPEPEPDQFEPEPDQFEPEPDQFEPEPDQFEPEPEPDQFEPATGFLQPPDAVAEDDF